jgi:Zn finger protein HypA/HybF involved in hydrogenase expression
MDRKDFEKNNPGVKIGEFTEEDVEIPTVKVDPETRRVSMTTKLEKQKTMYIESVKEKIRCKDGEHVFDCVDTHKYIFTCKNCRYSRQVYPSTYKFENGKLIHRVTGKVI